MPGPTRFEVRVRRVQETVVHIWVDGTTMSDADKGAAIGRAEALDEWDEDSVDVVGLRQDPPVVTPEDAAEILCLHQGPWNGSIANYMTCGKLKGHPGDVHAHGAHEWKAKLPDPTIEGV